MKRSLLGKLTLFVITGIILTVGMLGFYFNTFLKKNFQQTTKSRMQRGFERLNVDLATRERGLRQGITFIQSDDAFLASVYLVNNYQDKQHYNAVLLDEEKKSIAHELRDRVKISLNHDIALYDQNEELIAFVSKEPAGYRQNFFAYDRGERTLYTKLEDETAYHPGTFTPNPLIPFRHKSYYDLVDRQSTITYHFYQDTLVVRSHQSLFEKDHIVAHIEMSFRLGDAYFAALSEDLGITFTLRPDPEAAVTSAGFSIVETAKNYVGVMHRATIDGPVRLTATLDKAPLIAALHDNRRQLLLFLLLASGIVLIVLRFLFIRGLAHPLSQLMEQIREVERGDYTAFDPVHTGDEIEAISVNVVNLADTIRVREAALQKSQQTLEYLSHHDELTTLPNRRFFMTRLEQALRKAAEHGTGVVIMFLDLDEFKQVNDTLGHDVGDELLAATARRLLATIDTEDMLARIGGDEFMLMLEDCEEHDRIEAMAHTLMAAFTQPFQCREHLINATASIGIARFPDDGTDATTLIKGADLAMYRAKAAGRNHFSFFSRELAELIEARSIYLNALKEALNDGNQFRLTYQPKVSVATRRIVSAEALIRWSSPSLGEIPPDRFIPLAEETGLIIPIGEWAMIRAFKDFMALEQEGIALEHISVNVSGMQLIGSDLIATVINAARITGIAMHRIELEITESYIASNAEMAVVTLQKLRAMQINLAIDDFGTGYSSMRYLQQLPVTRLKIDKSFIDGVPGSAENVAVVHAIIALAKTFGLSITAEGVEKATQLAFLEREQCDEIQGFHYSPPLDLDTFRQFYRTFAA